MIKIKFFSDFCDSSHCRRSFERTCNVNNIDFYGQDKDVYFTDYDDYTHAIILNKAMPVLNIPKQNVLGLAFEPYEFLQITPEFIDYAKKNIGKYYIGSKHSLPEPFIEHFSYMCHISPNTEINHKSKVMSIVLSNKKFAPGHEYRHELVKKITELKLPIDIYGRGSSNYKGPNSKGEFKDIEPYKDYLYSICIENFKNNHYISEKIMTPLLHNCMPIYNGCYNINEYFDDLILLSGDLTQDIKLLISILKNPMKYYKPTYTDKNIKTVNILYNIYKVF